MEIGIRHESGATRKIADLALEILHLVEIVRPVQETLGAGSSAQVDRVAQPLAHARHVPDATIMAAVVVTGRAAQVPVFREARVPCVVEQLLAGQDAG
jgi:hypothetical protein